MINVVIKGNIDPFTGFNLQFLLELLLIHTSCVLLICLAGVHTQLDNTCFPSVTVLV